MFRRKTGKYLQQKEVYIFYKENKGILVLPIHCLVAQLHDSQLFHISLNSLVFVLIS